MDKGQEKTVYGIPMFYYALFVIIVLAGLIMEKLPDNMMVGFTICLMFGTCFNYIGSHIPVFKSLGGGTILAVMGPALMVYFGILPESAQNIAKNFFSGYDFTSLIIPSLIVGSILAMKRDILIKAGARFFLPMIGTLIGVIVLTGAMGMAAGYGFTEGALLIAGPIMGAGMGMAAIPLSEVYGSVTGQGADTFLSTLSAAVMLANILTILAAAILGSMGKKNPNMFFKGFSGEGRILRSEGRDLDSADFTDENEDGLTTTYRDLGIGFFTAGVTFVLGRILGSFTPAIHSFLWMVIIASSCKIFKLLPEAIEYGCGQWNKFITKVLTPCMLAAIGLGIIDFGKVIVLLKDVRFLLLCVAAVLLAIVVAGALGYFSGFYFVESAIMAGIGLADMGGTGDIAVLSASGRMNLLPFLQISSRIGGALDILILTMMAQYLL